MSTGNIEPYDWFNRFFGNLNNRRRGLFDTRDIFREFDDMQKEMERMSNIFNNISSNAPKELIKEYETKEGDKVREIGPIVYGYSMTVGPDGRPHVREFGNVKSLGRKGGIQQQISAEREPLSDVNSTDNEVKVVLEMPGIKKEDIKINAYNGAVEVIADSINSQRKYQKTIDLPDDADIETARSTYNNGILEIIFDKKKDMKPKGKEIKIE
jgi:HSP20 family protein